MSEINEQEVNVTENAAEEEKVVVERVIERTVVVEKEAAPQLKVNGCGIAGLVLGILGLLTSFCGFGGILAFIGFVLSIIGLCLKNCKKGLAVAGLIVSIIGSVVGLGVGLIYAGTLAPQMIRYNEKVDAYSDEQLCDTVKTAIMTAMYDPEVLNDEASLEAIESFSDGYDHRITEITTRTEFGKEIEDIMCMDMNQVEDSLKNTGNIYFTIDGNTVNVYSK